MGRANASEVRPERHDNPWKCHSFQGGPLAVLTVDGKYVIANGIDGVLVHRTSDGKCVASHEYRYTFGYAFVLSPDGKTIAAVLNDSRVLLWDVPSLLPKPK